MDSRFSSLHVSVAHSRLARHILRSRVYTFPLLGFGKDTLMDTYKPVWLYNSSELGLDNAITCEIFDFTANAWRYVLPSSPLPVIAHREPLFFDGSLHWFTEGQEETKVLSFHLHTETFQVLSKAPFVGVDHRQQDIAMCSLDDRFCVTQKKHSDQVQLIWSFDSGNKTWVKLYSIDLNVTSSWFGIHTLPLSALALPARTGNKKKKKTKLLLYDREYYEREQRLVLHDPETKSYDLVNIAHSIGTPLSYFQSLISVS